MNLNRFADDLHSHDLDAQITAYSLLTFIEPVSPETSNAQVYECFNDNPALRVIPVVKNGVPLGIIQRDAFICCIDQSRENGRAAQQSCKEFIKDEPLLVERNMPLEELSHFLAEAEVRHFADGFIITEQGHYIGVASGQDMLRVLTRMQIAASRHANPLTNFPGLVHINQQISRMLSTGIPFVACHANLNHFKAFNTSYGYRQGDEMIRLTGRILNWACDPKRDYIGHTGGDDFILLMQSRDWRARCENALDSFARVSALLFKEEHLSEGGYLHPAHDDSLVFHPLTSLSIGAIKVSCGVFDSFHEVNAAMRGATQTAKQQSGCSLFVDPSFATSRK